MSREQRLAAADNTSECGNERALGRLAVCVELTPQIRGQGRHCEEYSNECIGMAQWRDGCGSGASCNPLRHLRNNARVGTDHFWLLVWLDSVLVCAALDSLSEFRSVPRALISSSRPIPRVRTPNPAFSGHHHENSFQQ